MADYKDLFNMFFEAGRIMMDQKKYTVAAENFSKAIFAVIDFFIEKKLGIPPANHNKRKELVEMSFRKYLPILKKTYKIHRMTYRSIVDKGSAEVLMKYAEKLGKEAGFIE